LPFLDKKADLGMGAKFNYFGFLGKMENNL
jgi:hypothetical protein